MIKCILINLSLFLALALPQPTLAKMQNQRSVITDVEDTTPVAPDGQTNISTYESENYINAINELTPFSIQTVVSPDGEADVQFILAEMYLGEKIISANYDKAIELLNKAAKNHISAQFSLGLMYLIGNELKQDKVLAKKWLSKAAQSGDQNAKYCLDKEFKNTSQSSQLTISNEWVKNVMSQKNAEALNRLANLYLLGHWVHQDEKLALYWFFEAAEKGSADAQNKLGLFYQYGDYVNQDYTAAVEWYRKAADQNDAWGQYYLGNMYHDGIGVGADVYQAAEWFKKAATQGLASAQFNLGNFYKRETTNPDYNEAFRWYEKAANQEHSAAQNNLGIMYDNGLGCKKNYSSAKSFYIKAANQGDLGAANNLAILFGDGKGVKKNLIVEYAMYIVAAKESIEASQNLAIVADKLSQKQIDKAESLAKQLEVKGNFKKALDAYLKQSKS